MGLTVAGFLFGISELALIFILQSAWLTVVAENIFHINTASGQMLIPNSAGIIFLLLGASAVLFVYYLFAWYVSGFLIHKTN